MRRLWLTIFAALMALAPVGLADDGGTESVFNHGAGARAMGMGNAFTALSDDATAIYYNPAGLTLLETQQISLLHSVLFEETIYDYIAYVHPLSERDGIGVAVMRLGTDDIGRRNEVTDLGRFNASQMQFLLSYGRKFNHLFSSGATFKMAHQSIDDLTAYGFGLDLAGRVRLTSKLRGGILLQDIIGPRLKLAGTRERTPFTIRTGLAYMVDFKNLPFSGTVAFDLDKPENRSVKLHTGFEGRHSSGLIVRGGYDRDNISLGFGLRYGELTFDYAYKFIDRLTDSHRFSLTFNFGVTPAEKAARQADADRAAGLRYIDRSRQDAYQAELERADRFYAEGTLDSALAAYYRADAFVPGKTHVRTRIVEIQDALAVSTPPTMIMVDSGMVDLGLDFEKRARELFIKGDLIGARNMTEAAGQYQLGSESLDILENEINQAINREIWTELAKAENAYSLGDFIIAYDSYNSVLMYDPQNETARAGSARAEEKLNLSQHLNLALEYFNQGKYLSSQRELRNVLRIDSSNQTALEYMTRIEAKIKKSTTLEDLQKDSRIWQIYLDGLEAFRRGQYEKAIEYWDVVLEAYPNNKNTIENIEQARLRLNK